MAEGIDKLIDRLTPLQSTLAAQKGALDAFPVQLLAETFGAAD